MDKINNTDTSDKINENVKTIIPLKNELFPDLNFNCCVSLDKLEVLSEPLCQFNKCNKCLLCKNFGTSHEITSSTTNRVYPVVIPEETLNLNC